MTWPRPARTAALALALPLTLAMPLAGCKGIDKSQWSDFPPSTSEGASGVQRTTSGDGQVIVEQRQQVSTSDDSGVIGGASRGSRRSATSTVVLTTDPDTCWVLVVDGNYHRGCGDARISDVYGSSAGRVTKLSGDSPIQLELISSTGQTVDSGQVISSNHYVTVRG